MTTTMALMIGLKGMVALTAAAGVALLLREAPASRRHLVWAGGLGALLLLPALQIGGPSWSVPVPESAWTAGSVASAARPAREGRVAPIAGDDERWDGPGVADDGVGGLPTTLDRSDRAVATDDGIAAAAAGTPPSPPLAESRGIGESVAPIAILAPALRLVGPAALAVWLAGALLLGLRLVRGHRAARRLVGTSVPVNDGTTRRARRLAHDMGIRTPVTVRMHRALGVPIVTGLRRATILLPADAPTWSAETLDHVLLHELAHVIRRDPLTHLLADATRALHWPNPMAWLAVRRLRQESERACDDRVLAHGRHASGYAEDLLRVARTLRSRAAPRAAAVAMARTPDLSARLEALLDPRRPRQAAGPRAVLGTAAAAVLLSVGLGGAVPAEAGVADVPPSRPSASAEVPRRPSTQEDPRLCPFPHDAGGRSTSIHSDGEDVRLRIEQDDCRFEMVGSGEIVFSTDDRSVASIGAGGRLDLEERSGRREHRVRFLPGGGGLERLWWVDGERRPWGPEADAWVAAVLPWIFQETTLNAEPRVRRMLAEGGVDRVLDAAATMESAHVARRYIELAVEHGQVDEDQAIRIMRIAGDMDADHHKASLLKAMAEHQGLGTDRLRQPFLDAATSIDADHHVRSVLELLLDQPNLTMDQRDAVLLAATRIEADHHVAAILERVVREGGMSEAGRRTFMTVLLSIDADHHRRNVIETFLDAGRLSPGDLATVLELVDEVDADHHRAAVLQRVADGYALEGGEIDAFQRAALGIEADHHLRSVAEMISGRDALSAEQVEMVLVLAGSVGSDHHRLAVLESVARRHALTGTQRDRYERLAEEMDERRADQALAVLYRGSR